MNKVFILLIFLAIAKIASAQKVFSVEYANQADIKVFVVNYQNQADLKVFKVKYENQAGENDGKWFFTKYENQAGWENREKMYLMY